MRRAAYEALSDPRRRLLHRQTAEALAGVDAPAGSVATHYAASDRPWLALEPALAAAEQAAAWRPTTKRWPGASRRWRSPRPIPRRRLPASAPACTFSNARSGTIAATWNAAWTPAAPRWTRPAAKGIRATELLALWHLAHDETQAVAGGLSGLQTRAVTLAHAAGRPGSPGPQPGAAGLRHRLSGRAGRAPGRTGQRWTRP